MTRRVSFAGQALLLQLGVLIVVLAAGLGLVTLLVRDELEEQFEQRALAIAHTVAADPVIAVDVTSGPPGSDGDAQQRAERIRQRTGALFVVITDGSGIRYSHPNPAVIGERVSTDPTDVLAGQDVVAIEKGTLGLSARGKTPLRDAGGQIVGEVSVGIDADAVHARVLTLLGWTLGFGALALVLGMAGATLLARRLKRQTLGLEPTELADLVREHDAVLHGVQDGVVAVDRDRISMANDEARRLLGDGVRPGASVADVLPRRLADVVATGAEACDLLVLTEDRTLQVSSGRVRRGNRDLGVVLTVRDRTQVEHLGRELGTVRALFDALRAQSHEHSNRLHVLTGLLQLGQVEDAREYLDALVGDPLSAGDEVARVRDPYLRGLLAAKSSAAAERGVTLRLADDAALGSALTAPLDVVTVLGNLIDNAVRAAADGPRRPAWVEVQLAADGTGLLVAVTDSGDGIDDQTAGRMFEDGWTTRTTDPAVHGVGLALARQTARRHGGDVDLLTGRGPDHGAVFAATMRDVVACDSTEVSWSLA